VLVWREAGRSTHDLSGLFDLPVRVVGLESGAVLGSDASAVLATLEPVLVTETTGPGLP